MEFTEKKYWRIGIWAASYIMLFVVMIFLFSLDIHLLYMLLLLLAAIAAPINIAFAIVNLVFRTSAKKMKAIIFPAITLAYSVLTLLSTMYGIKSQEWELGGIAFFPALGISPLIILGSLIWLLVEWILSLFDKKSEIKSKK